ncbi:GL16026, partial [Drosophila persimilis]
QGGPGGWCRRLQCGQPQRVLARKSESHFPEERRERPGLLGAGLGDFHGRHPATSVQHHGGVGPAHSHLAHWQPQVEHPVPVLHRLRAHRPIGQARRPGHAPDASPRLLHERQIGSHQNRHDPVQKLFDEHFVFEVAAGVIDKRTVEILLYDFDAYSRHVCIGGTKLHLANIDLSEQLQLWTPLSSASAQDMKVDLGDIMVSLGLPSLGRRLMVVLIKARNLRIVDDARTPSDPYV